MIRTITIDELGRVEDAAREFYRAAPALGANFRIDHFRSVWTDILRARAGVIFADWQPEGDGEAIAGVIGGIVHREIYGDAIIAEEFFWFVREAHRGAGVLLYRRFEQWAREKGAQSIQMVHLFDSMPEKVAKFYLHSGFRPVEMRYAKDLTRGRAAAA